MRHLNRSDRSKRGGPVPLRYVRLPDIENPILDELQYWYQFHDRFLEAWGLGFSEILKKPSTSIGANMTTVGP